MWKKVVSVLVGLMMLMVMVAPANAAREQVGANAIQAAIEQQQQVDVAAQKLQRFLVRYEDGTFALDLRKTSIKKLGISDGAYRQIVMGMGLINNEIQMGNLVSDANGSVFVKGSNSISIQSNENSITFLWYGIRWALSNTTVQRILGVLTAGGGVAGVVAAITGAIPGAQVVSAALWVVAGVMATGIGWLTYLNAPGRGVYIYTAYTGSPLWGKSQ